MLAFYLIGFALLLVSSFTHRKMVRIDFSKVASFLGFIAIMVCIKIGLYDFGYQFDINYLKPGYPYHMMNGKLWTLMMVWWEEMVFVFPMFFIVKYFKRWLAFLSILAISVCFALGHAYQGIPTMIMIGFYPYFISYRFGKKYGLGTVMVCHIIYDFSVVLTLAASANRLFY